MCEKLCKAIDPHPFVNNVVRRQLDVQTSRSGVSAMVPSCLTHQLHEWYVGTLAANQQAIIGCGRQPSQLLGISRNPPTLTTPNTALMSRDGPMRVGIGCWYGIDAELTSKVNLH
jgi:hypothetical protein